MSRRRVDRQPGPQPEGGFLVRIAYRCGQSWRDGRWSYFLFWERGEFYTIWGPDRLKGLEDPDKFMLERVIPGGYSTSRGVRMEPLEGCATLSDCIGAAHADWALRQFGPVQRNPRPKGKKARPISWRDVKRRAGPLMKPGGPWQYHGKGQWTRSLVGYGKGGPKFYAVDYRPRFDKFFLYYVEKMNWKHHREQLGKYTSGAEIVDEVEADWALRHFAPAEMNPRKKGSRRKPKWKRSKTGNRTEWYWYPEGLADTEGMRFKGPHYKVSPTERGKWGGFDYSLVWVTCTVVVKESAYRYDPPRYEHVTNVEDLGTDYSNAMDAKRAAEADRMLRHFAPADMNPRRRQR